jgi:hypothetical protein
MQFVPAYQLVAYVALTFASVFVASMSAFVAWRQIRGWKPSLFVTGMAATSVAGTDHTFKATVTMEIWNRRKYPIAMTGGSSVSFGSTEVDEVIGSNWKRWRNTVTYHGDKVVVDSLKHEEIVAVAILRVPKGQADIAPRWEVKIKYFDPVANKELELKATANYSEPERNITRG